MKTDHAFIESRLRGYALERFLSFARFPLAELAGPCDVFCRLPDTFLGFLVRNRAQTLDWLDFRLNAETPERESAQEFFRRSMIRFLHGKNQYIVIPDERIRDLDAEYVRFLRCFRESLSSCAGEETLGRELYRVLAEHKRIIDSFVTGLETENASLEFLYREPVCAEYSPGFQLAVLGLDPNCELEPVLDLGCGSEARLVNWLRARGKDAQGVDRALNEDDSADWLRFSFKPGQWGTIVSHMAFSIHFLHHHLRPEGLADVYARRYMDILRSLKPGGSFLYAPGLPFLENLLPEERYRIERRSVREYFTGSGIDAGETPFDSALEYSCRVRRIG